MTGILIGILEQGLIYGVMALGAYISYSILKFPDLTVDGSFPLGGAVAAICISQGMDPWLACLLALLAGAAAGLLTGLIHVKLRVTDLLSGILMMTVLYSINLRIAGRANLPFYDQGSIFHGGLLSGLPSQFTPYSFLLLLGAITLAVKYVLDAYLRTRSGLLLRATGDNAHMTTQVARDSGAVKIFGLSLSNALVALGGALMCQYQRVFDISMGPGTVVIGLASVIMGLSIFGRLRFIRPTSAVLLGAILYKAAVSGALQLGFQPGDLKLIIGIILLVALVLQRRLGNGRRKGHAASLPNPKDL